MAKRLIMLMVVLALAVGVLAGTPLRDPNGSMPECCKRARSKERSPQAEAARLCCAVNCSTTTPTSSSTSFNSAPVNFTITASIADRIAAIFAKKTAVVAAPAAYSREILLLTFQPSYIQHHSFLI